MPTTTSGTAHVTLGTVHFNLDESLRHWVNDGLMAIFFFVVGLEIKREVLVGELASPRRAALPAIAALGGVLVPAGIYLAVNAGHAGEEGWGVPMATDIAFALGVLAVLGDRVPIGLKVFLTALAIVDDILAVLVIALFYSGEPSRGTRSPSPPRSWSPWSSPTGSARGSRGSTASSGSRSGRRCSNPASTPRWPGCCSPSRSRPEPGSTPTPSSPAAGRCWTSSTRPASTGTTSSPTARARRRWPSWRTRSKGAGAPLHRLEHALHPWVAFAIVPLFALANAGVAIGGDVGETVGNRITLGVILGLVLGKQIGITLAAWLAVRSGATTLPEGVSWRQVYGAAWLAGIGFTMSLFVADLAFAGSDEADFLTSAKLGIVGASVIAGAMGWLLLSRGPREEAAE